MWELTHGTHQRHESARADPAGPGLRPLLPWSVWSQPMEREAAGGGSRGDPSPPRGGRQKSEIARAAAAPSPLADACRALCRQLWVSSTRRWAALASRPSPAEGPQWEVAVTCLLPGEPSLGLRLLFFLPVSLPVPSSVWAFPASLVPCTSQLASSSQMQFVGTFMLKHMCLFPP